MKQCFKKILLFPPLQESVPLGDPTCFAPVIDYVRQMAEDLQEPERNDYCVLLIVTDGGIKGGCLIFCGIYRKYRSFLRKGAILKE